MSKSRRSRRSMKSRGLSKVQKKQVASMIDDEIEDKSFVYTNENAQLDHNKPVYVSKFLGDIQQGVSDGDTSTTGGTGLKTIRIGDQIRLKNINIRFWLSNKWDRPNCIYKLVLFWYPVGVPPNDLLVYKTQTNKILDRYNTDNIIIIDQVIVKSTTNYSNTEVGEKEHSYLATLNKSYKNKKIQYDNNGLQPKGFNIGMAIVAYDAYGTLQTDNIASFAYQSLITFQDA